LVVLTIFISLPHRYAAAAVITTEEWIDRNPGGNPDLDPNLNPNLNQGETARDYLQDLISREEVKAALLSNGISYLEVKHRVDSLSDAEVIELADRIENLPAGGNGVGAIIGAVVLIFLVLLITDILGFTDVFPFVKSQGKR
jgi:hypothetical protein